MTTQLEPGKKTIDETAGDHAEVAPRTVGLKSRLRPADLHHAAGPITVAVDDADRHRIAHGRGFLRRALAGPRAVYGATTGFGALVGFAGRETETDQADNALAHLGAGQGPDIDLAVARAAMLLRTWSLAQGLSGVSPHVIDALVATLATTFTPAMPRLGSVGASGDLIPLGAAAQALRGRGFAYVDGVRMPASAALTAVGLRPLPLDGRDALALVNGTSLTSAALTLAARRVRAAHRASQLLSCLLVEMLGCAPEFLDPRLLAAYHHPGAIAVGAAMRGLLGIDLDVTGSAARDREGQQDTTSGRAAPPAERGGSAAPGKRPLQEPYSIRCVPQLLGAAEDALRYVDGVVDADLGSVSDNPLFFPDDDDVVHGGNFFGQPAAFAADVLTMVTGQLGNLTERQLDLLVDPHRNGGLPPMLAAGPGRQHGLQGVQLASTALVAELRRDSVPASAQSLPTNLHNQDVIPLGTQAALRAFDQARLLWLICGSLAVGLRQAVYVGARWPRAPRCAAILERLVAAIPPVDPDRPLDGDVRLAASLLDEAVHTADPEATRS